MAAEWCSSRVGCARGFAARSLAPRVARAAHPFREMASRTFPATWSDCEWSCAEVGRFEGASGQPVTTQRQDDIKKSEAGDRVQKLQQALDILGDTEGPEVDGLRAALKRAETAPIDKQVKDCEAFLSRARAHLEELEQKRSAVAASISAARLPATSPTNAEVQRLQDLVSHLQAQLRGGDPDIPCGPVAKRPCRAAQRVLVLSTPAELSAWLEERHADLHDALVNGDNGRILEFTTTLAASACGVDREHLSMRTSARCGLRVSRVGEASHPGSPPGCVEWEDF